MNHTLILKRVFFALGLGVFLIYALGGAAIASASISGHTDLIPGITSVMVSLGMTWLMVLGIPCLALASHHIYKSMYGAFTDLSDNAKAALTKNKIRPANIEDFDRLRMTDEQQPSYRYDVEADKLKEMQR